MNHGDELWFQHHGTGKGFPAPGLFISGMSWQAGKFRVIIPVRLGDFVPVWETEQEAVAVIGKFKASVAGNDSISSPWKSPPAFSQAGR